MNWGIYIFLAITAASGTDEVDPGEHLFEPTCIMQPWVPDTVSDGRLGFDPDDFLNLDSEGDQLPRSSNSRPPGYERLQEHFAPQGYSPSDFLSDLLGPPITHNVEHRISSSSTADEGGAQMAGAAFQPHATNKGSPTDERQQADFSSSEDSFQFQPNGVSMQPLQPSQKHDDGLEGTFDQLDIWFKYTQDATRSPSEDGLQSDNPKAISNHADINLPSSSSKNAHIESPVSAPSQARHEILSKLLQNNQEQLSICMTNYADTMISSSSETSHLASPVVSSSQDRYQIFSKLLQINEEQLSICKKLSADLMEKSVGLIFPQVSQKNPFEGHQLKSIPRHIPEMTQENVSLKEYQFGLICRILKKQNPDRRTKNRRWESSKLHQ
ncbi:hypothetical protein PTTG_11788 [Puccinia triticina 1-1 BBBD Race 1]|uniref:Uncharacterized protein n=1 Tax=Puccinia triticina (isolate 1-1 / race 1 (BBBD)) TaxID=630390 RepID=A0A180GY58_PUCT1|nr:hypothetical protein PTTG_11788 [Puccinia triticina 1-1 BBBD Race 1]